MSLKYVQALAILGRPSAMAWSAPLTVDSLRIELTGAAGLSEDESHGIEFKRQVAQDFIAGETPHGLAKRHDISRNLIRI
jgi:hypothetical protein